MWFTQCLHLLCILCVPLQQTPLSGLEGVRRAVTGECDVVVCVFVDCQSHVAPYTDMQL